MDYGLIIAIIALIVTIVIAIRRSRSTARQIDLLDQQVANQNAELEVMRQLVGSFDRVVSSYDVELDSMRNLLQLASGEAMSPADAASIEAERERQKAEKKRQKEEAKLIKKYMKALGRQGE